MNPSLPEVLSHSAAALACPACNGSRSTVADRIGEFDIRRCVDCGLRFADPLVYEQQSYDEAYAAWLDSGSSTDFVVPSTRWLAESSPQMKEAWWLTSSVQKLALQWICDHFPAGAEVLDVGCGSGWFLAECRRAGLQPYGVEVGSAPVRILKERGFRVQRGSVENAPDEWPEPRVVTLFEVLEHLPEPVEFLRKVRARFPRSTFILSVPGPRRWTKLGRLRDISDFPPNHLTQWDERCIVAALTRAGFGPPEIRFAPPTALEITSAGFRPLIRCWLRPRDFNQLSQAIGSSAQQRPLAQEIRVRRWKRPFAALPSLLFRVLGLSGFSMLAICRPEGRS